MAKAGQSAQSQWAAAGFALPEYHFDSSLRDHDEIPRARKPESFSDAVVSICLIAGERWLRQHLGNGGQCIP
jgi:hypothetical protein